MQHLITALWLVGKFAISSSFVGVWLFGAEIFPTTIRTTGLGICNIASRIGGILAPFSKSMVGAQSMIHLIKKVLQRLVHPFFVPGLFGVCSLMAAIMTLFLPETTGAKLADEISGVDYGPVLSKCLRSQQLRPSFDEHSATSRLIIAESNGK